MHNRGVGLHRVVIAALGIVAVALTGLMGLIAPVAAQTGYPGPTSTTPPQRSEERQNAGQVRAGETVFIESCGFAAGSGAEVSFNGSLVGADVANAQGCVVVEFSVRQDCPGVVVNGVPREGVRGRNEIVVSGTGSNAAGRTVITGVTVSCSEGGGVRAASSGSATGGGGSIAGDERTRSLADPEAGVIASVEGAGAGGGPLGATFGRVLAATGSFSGRLAALGALLVLAGVVIVVADRRRRRHRAAL